MNATTWQRALPCLACPHCGETLALVDGGVVCARGHRFDLAHEGYLHLLPGTGRRAAQVGDSRAMLQARRAFLASGYYAPIAEALARHVAAALARPAATAIDTQGCVLDVGCGEGYYLGRIQQHLDALGTASPPLIGLDVAKDAARLAARAHPRLAVLVADATARLPARDGSANVLLSIFAPRNPVEFARVVRPDGRLLVVIPTEEHLSSLRAHVPLLVVEPDKRAQVVARLAGKFTLSNSAPLRYELALTGSDAAHLVAMSPSARHVAEPELAALAERRDPITTTVSVELLTFRRDT